ncbi:hypothetical protein [Kitasatospora sp. NPDC094011]|uniref:hypothetical protein n=1 Tax=Kitasatospora sp. NPDC094011 TaxID=3364090 RepID=UPI0038018513
MTTEPTTGAPLVCTLTTEPGRLTRSASDTPHRGRLEIAVARAAGVTGAVHCRGITVEVPTGDAPRSLTTQPERIGTAYRARHGRTWWISASFADPRATVFTCVPRNPRREAEFDGPEPEFTLLLDSIPLTGSPGEIGLRITTDSRDATGAAVRSGTELTVTVSA